jgi:hypothetical protein
MQPSNISAVFAKVEHFNFGQITNHLLLPFLEFQPPFHPDNSAFGIHFRVQCAKFVFARFEKCCCRFFVPPKQNTAGSVTASSAADPVDFEEMAAEQNRCP